MNWTVSMTPTTVLEVVGRIALGNYMHVGKIKLRDSIKRYTYPSLIKAIPQTKIKLNNKIKFDITKDEKSSESYDNNKMLE